MTWFPLAFDVVTPMFLGGPTDPAHPNDDRGRPRCQPATQFVPSLRGALRVSYRMLVGGAFQDPGALLRAEGRLFGAAADDGSGGQSKVLLRLTDRGPTVSSGGANLPNWLNQRQPDGKWIAYLLGPGCFKPGSQRDGTDPTLLRSFVAPGASVSAMVRVRGGDAERTALAGALWAFQRFGGIGSRNRKGFGTLRLTPASIADGPWSDVERRWLTSPFGVPVRDVVTAVREALGLPTVLQLPPTPFAMLDEGCSVEKTIASVAAGPEGWAHALGMLGEQWRLVRTAPAPGVRYQPQVKTREWMDLVGDPAAGGGEMPIASLGLPIVFKQNVSTSLYVGGDEWRLASPVLFRPWVTERGTTSAQVTGFFSSPAPPGGQIVVVDGRVGGGRRPMTLTAAQAAAKVNDTVKELVEACRQLTRHQ